MLRGWGKPEIHLWEEGGAGQQGTVLGLELEGGSQICISAFLGLVCGVGSVP